jgi:predicted DNA-binding transcriptional regulator AlpA
MGTTAFIDLTLLMTQVTETVREAVAAEARPGWRERLWSCEPKTRLWLDEVSEAMGKSKAAVRALIRRHGLPCRRRHGELVFLAGEVREWMRVQEQVVRPSVIPAPVRPRRLK